MFNIFPVTKFAGPNPILLLPCGVRHIVFRINVKSHLIKSRFQLCGIIL